MKVSLRAEVLKDKLLFVNHAITNKNQLPILLNILLVAKDNVLSLKSTDLEIGIQTNLSAEIIEEGAITVPAKTFNELIGSLTVETITLETKDNILLVTSKKTKSKFPTMPPEEFPRLYEEKGTLIASISSDKMKKEFGSVVFSASSDTARPALSGVLVKQEANGFLLVATDGYRLSLKHYTVGAEDKLQLIEGDTSMLVPARVFKEVLALKEEGSKLLMYVSKEKNQLVFEQNETILIGRLIEAEYPNYEKIIPGDFSVRASFDREEMLKAVKICSIFARDTANIIKFSLQQDKIVVSAGDNTVDVDATIKGEENEIAFNTRYLLDALSNIEEEILEFEMTGPLNPGVFKIKDDTSFLHLIMPIRIQQ